MLERLQFILGVCVSKGTRYSDHIAALNQNGESLRDKGALAVVICAIRILRSLKKSILPC